jgi:hypothetical protein
VANVKDYDCINNASTGQSTSTLYSNSGLKYQWNPILNNNNGAFEIQAKEITKMQRTLQWRQEKAI